MLVQATLCNSDLYTCFPVLDSSLMYIDFDPHQSSRNLTRFCNTLYSYHKISRVYCLCRLDCLQNAIGTLGISPRYYHWPVETGDGDPDSGGQGGPACTIQEIPCCLCLIEKSSGRTTLVNGNGDCSKIFVGKKEMDYESLSDGGFLFN